MNKYTSKLKEMSTNFSYDQFVELLKEIDIEVIDGNICDFDQEFIHYFTQVTNLAIDNYIVDGEPGTVGHMLVENALINKERLTPTLAMYFFLEQKRNLELENVCNNISFSNIKAPYHMMICRDNDTGNLNFNINYYHCEERAKRAETDTYNYILMTEILHELAHVYQMTRTEQSPNLFERLVYYDSKQLDILSTLDVYPNQFFHQAVIGEFMADEQAHVFMLHLSQNHPEYFNSKLINQKQIAYQKRKIGHTGPYGNLGSNPREAYSELLDGLNESAIQIPTCDFLKPLLEEIENLRQKSQPIIEDLQAQGFSERGCDIYYNIFEKFFYSFDGKQIVIRDGCIERFNKPEISTEEVQEKENEEYDSSLKMKVFFKSIIKDALKFKNMTKDKLNEAKETEKPEQNLNKFEKGVSRDG